MMFVVFYFLLIRPQKVKEDQRQEMLKQLKKNDRVLTTGGIYGTVMSAKDNEVVLRVDDNVKIRFARNAIVGVENGKGEGVGGTAAS
ncbi:MAG: preprotein translocase subunit YajC [Planctomycetes bacterium]|nr:preprotein translocase subunit YajC [Planctomycetota bacterium]